MPFLRRIKRFKSVWSPYVGLGGSSVSFIQEWFHHAYKAQGTIAFVNHRYDAKGFSLNALLFHAPSSKGHLRPQYIRAKSSAWLSRLIIHRNARALSIDVIDGRTNYPAA